MRNTTLTAPLAKNSSKVQRRKRQLYLRKSTLISPQAFAKMHNGSLRMKVIGKSFYFGFVSETQSAHAWGCSFPKAYRNMLQHFHEKYVA